MSRSNMKWSAILVGAVLLSAGGGAVAGMLLDNDSRSTGAAPLPRSATEKKILAVLARMNASGETFLDVGSDGGRLLRLLAESTDAKNVVEIGTSTGISGLWLALALTSTGGRLTTFEIDAQRAAQARAHFEEAGVAGLVTVVEGDAHKNLNVVKAPIDLVFIDADKEGYPDYLAKLLPLVRPGGIVVADNIRMAPAYAAALARNPDLDTVLANGMSISLKKRQ
jgi:predicted O-methyltransferase YrrM